MKRLAFSLALVAMMLSLKSHAEDKQAEQVETSTETISEILEQTISY